MARKRFRFRPPGLKPTTKVGTLGPYRGRLGLAWVIAPVVAGLIILVEGRLLIAGLDVDTMQYGAPVELAVQRGDGRLEVGDVNGDGVDDFAFTIGTDVTVMLGVPAAPRGAKVETIEGGTP